MPTWSGWQNQFLNRAGIIETPPNRTFLDEWAKHAPGSCKNNPVDLTTSVSGSTRCGDTVGGFGRSQNYGTHTQAAHAFSIQIHTSWVKPLRDAMNSGNPFQIGDRSQVVAVLNRWASPSFADWYATANNDGTGGGSGGGGGGGGGADSASAHKGWHQLRTTVNHKLPGHVSASHKMTQAALRKLSHIRRVRV